MIPALQTQDLCKHFGALYVTHSVSLRLEPGARHALIGPNGAGKTTLVNLISGSLRADRGNVLLGGEDISSLTQAERVKRGLARTFQINQLFRELTVVENVAMSICERTGVSQKIWRRASTYGPVLDEAMELLHSLHLHGDALTEVRELPYGRQRLVEIAITLGLKPSVLLLDEPAAGVPSAESHIILDVIASLPDDIAILIIEHDMEIVFQFAKSISVLVAGSVLVEGTPEEITANEEVRAVYLGADGDD